MSEFLPSFKPLSLTIASLMNEIRTVFSELPDSRKVSTSNNLKYDVTDAVLSAFSVFFTQSPSFLDYQVRMQKECGKNNAQSIFGVHKLPSDNHNVIYLIQFCQKHCSLYSPKWVMFSIKRVILNRFAPLATPCWWRWMAQIFSLRKRFPAPAVRNKPSKTAKP